MIGSKMYNKEKGQALLAIIVISSVILTIGLSLMQLTTRDTSRTKLSEDQKRAFAAAEAGIDAIIKLTPGASIQLNTLGLGAGISGDAVINQSSSSTYTTPVLNKDGVYTFYLADYDVSNNTFSGVFTEGFSISKISPAGDYCSGPEKFAVELTVMHSTLGVLNRYLIDECPDPLFEGTQNKIAFDEQSTITNGQVLFLRIIAPDDNFQGAQLTINRTAGNWPSQGKEIISTATTNTGVTKKIRLFQSYPQLPGDFIVSSF